MKLPTMTTIKAAFAASLLALGVGAKAEDVDLFLGLPGASSTAPNVLFIVDNAANWNRTSPAGGPYSDQITAALEQIFDSLESVDADGLSSGVVNAGVMFFAETGSDGEDGGFVRAAIREMNDTNKSLYADALAALDETNKSNNAKVGLAFAEAYYYFAGLRPFAGNNKDYADYAGNPSDGGTPGLTEEVCEIETVKVKGTDTEVEVCEETEVGPYPWSEVYALEGNALSSRAAETYNKPSGEGCVKSYIIFISNGPGTENTADKNKAITMMTDIGGVYDPIALSPSGQQGSPTDEWASFMRTQAPEEVRTFTIDIDPKTQGQGDDWTALLKSTAKKGDGKYYAVTGDASSIALAINDALSSILAVNSVFSSVALPASTNAQSTFLNQVYIGLFRPDEVANPRWYGNLKQYKLAFITTGTKKELKVVDVEEDPIVDAGTGFIRECAKSEWTPTTADNYWDFLENPRGECTTVANSDVSNYPDGPVVEKGGQAYVQRSGNPASRTAYTCSPVVADCDDFDVLSTAPSYVNQTTFLADDADDLTDTINWAKGADTEDEDGDSNYTETRPSVHGDIIHSQPVAIDYGSSDTPEVVVFYSGNDGMLRAINGNRSTTHNSTDAGEEFFAFMPPEFHGKVKRVRDNSTKVKFPATATGVLNFIPGELKDYGLDGALAAFDGYVGDDHRRILFAGMRRGGRTIYAFDVTNINSPSLMWRRGCPNMDDDIGCTENWGNIGQTWSKPNVIHIDGYDNPVLLFGGGYDNCEDYDNNVDANSNCDYDATNKGNSIFVVDGITGELLREFTETDGDSSDDIEGGIPGDVIWVPESDANLIITYAYAADTMGNVYRISGGDADAPASIGTADPADWVLLKVADLGCADATADCSPRRKFLYGPDVIREPEYGQLTIVIGSGDREKPLYDYGAARAVQNYIYAFIDSPLVPEWLDDADPAVCNEDVVCNAGLTTVGLAGDIEPSAKGWKFALRSTEQVVSGALVVNDLINVSTHIPVPPDPEACSSDLGTATTYNLHFDDAEGEAHNIISGGLSPTPVAGKVILDDGQIVPFCIGCGGEGSAIGATEIGGSSEVVQPTSRVSWEIEK